MSDQRSMNIYKEIEIIRIFLKNIQKIKPIIQSENEQKINKEIEEIESYFNQKIQTLTEGNFSRKNQNKKFSLFRKVNKFSSNTFTNYFELIMSILFVIFISWSFGLKIFVFWLFFAFCFLLFALRSKNSKRASRFSKYNFHDKH